jgi:DNA (cytosine-5)-methyltransferase 1
MNELALFSGVGGGILGGNLLGWRTVCGVECDPYAASVLVARQNDKTLPPFPIWSDIQTFDGRPWKRRVDVVSGGFPCTDISIAGRGAGIEGEQSSLWSHMARIVGEVQPRFVFLENSPMLVGRGLTRVISDLAQMGYDARWGIVGAHHASAPHKRDRIWIMAYTHPKGLQGNQCTRGTDKEGWQKSNGSTTECSGLQQQGKGYWSAEPCVGRMAHGVAHRVDRIKTIGNGQVPQVAALAWRLLTQDLNINNQQQ